MLQISKTRRDMWDLWKYATRHQEVKKAGRATHQQSVHLVRPWNSQVSIEEYSQWSTLWKLCRITNTSWSERFFGFRAEAQIQNDGGAPPRRRSVPNAHAWTRIHASRHGIIWQGSNCKKGIASYSTGLLQRPIQVRATLRRRRHRQLKDRRTPWK